MKMSLKQLKQVIREEVERLNEMFQIDYTNLKTASDAAQYLNKNWKKITGLPAKAKHEEGHWPESVDDFMDELEKRGICSSESFQDEWTMLFS